MNASLGGILMNWGKSEIKDQRLADTLMVCHHPK